MRNGASDTFPHSCGSLCQEFSPLIFCLHLPFPTDQCMLSFLQQCLSSFYCQLFLQDVLIDQPALFFFYFNVLERKIKI